MARAFDRQRELTLVLRARACYTTRDNLPLLRRELNQPLVVLVIDIYVAILAEPADFSLLDFFYWYQFYYSLFF